MITKPLIDKLGSIADNLIAEHGEFTLFGLFRRQGVDGHWDLVVSGTWLPRPSLESIDLIARRLRGKLTSNEMSCINAIIVAAPAAADFQILAKLVENIELPAEISAFEVFGTHMDHACIIRFHPPRAANNGGKHFRTAKVARR